MNKFPIHTIYRKKSWMVTKKLKILLKSEKSPSLEDNIPQAMDYSLY